VKAVNVTVRRSIAAAVVLAAAPVLASCGVNFGEQTDQVYNPSNGTDNRTGQVDVLNALIVSGKKGTGTVVAGLVNNNQVRPDQLVGVSAAGAQVTLGGPTTVPAGGLLNLAEKGGVQITGSQVNPGNFVTVSFSFAHAKSVTLELPVFQHKGIYAQVPVPAASPTPTGTPTKKPKHAKTPAH
jgi:hypothetical protein